MPIGVKLIEAALGYAAGEAGRSSRRKEIRLAVSDIVMTWGNAADDGD
jgi:hypothetical protein